MSLVVYALVSIYPAIWETNSEDCVVCKAIRSEAFLNMDSQLNFAVIEAEKRQYRAGNSTMVTRTTAATTQASRRREY